MKRFMKLVERQMTSPVLPSFGTKHDTCSNYNCFDTEYRKKNSVLQQSNNKRI